MCNAWHINSVKVEEGMGQASTWIYQPAPGGKDVEGSKDKIEEVDGQSLDTMAHGQVFLNHLWELGGDYCSCFD